MKARIETAVAVLFIPLTVGAWCAAAWLMERLTEIGSHLIGIRPVEFQVGVFIGLVGLVVTIGGMVIFDIPERKRWEAEAKKPVQFRLPGM